MLEFFKIVSFLFLVFFATVIVEKFFLNLNRKEKTIFFSGIFLKLFLGQAFALIYTFYYNNTGDTWGYFRGSKIFTDLLFENPTLYFERLLDIGASNVENIYTTNDQFRYRTGTSEIFVTKVASVMNIFSGNNFFTTTMLFSLLSFIGYWQLFKVFKDVYPSVKIWYLAFPFLFVPSAVFWGSGIMKDTLVVFGLGVFIHSLFQIRFGNKNKVFQFFLFVISFFVLLKSKIYVLLLLVPAILLFQFWLFQKTTRKIVNKVIFLPIILVVFTIVSYFALDIIGEYNPKYSIENSIKTSKDYQEWHSYLSKNDLEGGSSNYDLGTYEASFTGILSKIPAAVNVTLFRPYVWESKNPLMFLSSLESLSLLIFSVFVIIKAKPSKILNIIYSNPFMLSTLAFSIFFAFVVGFTSYNFGALARYKMPCIPFYLINLILILHFYQKNRFRENN